MRVTARSFGLVARKVAGRGSIKVYVDGHRVATINLSARSSGPMVVWSGTFTRVGKHRVTVVNLGSRHRTVGFDGLVVLR